MKQLWCTFLLMTLVISASFAQVENETLDPSAVETLTFEKPSQQLGTPDKLADAVFQPAAPFEKLYETINVQADLTKAVSLSLDQSSIDELFNADHEFISLAVPSFGESEIIVELAQAELFADGFRVVTSESNGKAVNVTLGNHYRGVLSGHPNSTAAFSIFEDELYGMISVDGSNIVVVPDEEIEGNYLMYNDADLNLDQPFSCEALEHPEMKPAPDMGDVPESAKCVEVYLECDYALHNSKGGVTGTVNWITAVYNNVATLYSNESINTAISEIYVWTSADGYSKTSSYSALTKFRSNNPTYNGDLAHLAALGGNNIGGIAWLDVLCSSYGYAYSNISAGYSPVPIYSWTVEVMTHEMGHNLGSNHTQWCGWAGGAIDNCYTPEGGCSPGPAPTGGGTIMSYCHLTSYGINFNNGFGPLPGNKIRAEVAAAGCLGTGCGGGGGCNTPAGLAISNIGTTTADANWNSVSSAVSYDFAYKTSTASTWTSVNTTSTSYSMTGLVSNTTYNTRVRTHCSGDTSAWSSTVNFTTKGTSSYCSSKGNSCTREWIRRVRLNSLDRRSGCDNGYYDGTHLSTSLTKGGYTPIYFQANRTGGSRRFYWRIWIDLNNNGSFSDPGELRVSGYSNSTRLLYSWLYVPSSATNGQTRMRVSMRYGGYPSACGNFSRGEVEDYTVDIRSTGTLEENVIDKDISKTNYKVSPNPTHDVTRLEFTTEEAAQVSLTLVDINGRPIKTWNHEAIAGYNFVEVDMMDLIRGSYYLQVDDGMQIKLMKLFKL